MKHLLICILTVLSTPALFATSAEPEKLTEVLYHLDQIELRNGQIVNWDEVDGIEVKMDRERNLATSIDYVVLNDGEVVFEEDIKSLTSANLEKLNYLLLASGNGASGGGG